AVSASNALPCTTSASPLRLQHNHRNANAIERSKPVLELGIEAPHRTGAISIDILDLEWMPNSLTRLVVKDLNLRRPFRGPVLNPG
ncbi:hypothetical protein, partial [Klebsiella pneumoniae]|uniref:hypothetical protein n=1 Tax=Klebsiella pneumoniae TaxID=573 RepID=UPI0038550E43